MTPQVSRLTLQPPGTQRTLSALGRPDGPTAFQYIHSSSLHHPEGESHSFYKSSSRHL